MTATLSVLSPGLCTLIVDHGRPRSRSLGVPLGGAADAWSFALGNALVRNPPGTPALEVCLMGPTLVADATLACVLVGAPFAMSTDRRDLTMGHTFTLEAGERLTIGGTPQGARAYLCVAGGVDGRMVLGSRSSLAPVRAGEAFSCQPGRIAVRWIAECADLNPVLRVLPGPQADWFPDGILGQLECVVSPASNRMGLRLAGPALPVTGREMVSEPVCPGTVQVTRDGQCIVLGVDGQTIGGYPRIAQVIQADMRRLGQLRPGDRVTFTLVDLEEAERLAQTQATQLREWQARLG